MEKKSWLFQNYLCKSVLYNIQEHILTPLTPQVSSVNKYDPPMDVVAATNHMTHLVYQLMQPQVLYDRFVLRLKDVTIKH